MVQLARLAGKQNRWNDELAASKQAIDLRALNFPAAYFSYAEASYHLDHMGDADRYCRSAIQLDPRAEVPEARLLLGIILARSGKSQEAIDNLRVFFNLVPQGTDEEKAREYINKLEQLVDTK